MSIGTFWFCWYVTIIGGAIATCLLLFFPDHIRFVGGWRSFVFGGEPLACILLVWHTFFGGDNHPENSEWFYTHPGTLIVNAVISLIITAICWTIGYIINDRNNKAHEAEQKALYAEDAEYREHVQASQKWWNDHH